MDIKQIFHKMKFFRKCSVDNFMKMRLDKMVVIRMKSRKRERKQRKSKLVI